MSQYQHTFSHYVNHILNKSPSKNTFSFSKADRFPKDKIEQPPLLPTNSTSHYFHELHHNTNRSPTRKSPEKSPRKQRQHTEEPAFTQSGYISIRNHQKIPSVECEVDHLLKKIQRKQKSRSPSGSPYRKHYKEYRTSPTKASIQMNRRSGGSPLKQRKSSPHKTCYTEMMQSNHPSKNITITGYYPVGIEINAEGKYPSSKIRNVTGSKFSPSPSPSARMNRERYEEKLGPDFYIPFSEFGPQ